MARPDKAAAVAELTEDFKSATATYLTEYRGLTVTSMKQLRRSLGADIVGGDELIDEVSKGRLDFDAVVATPDLMAKVGRLGKVLGTRGLMPNPKTGTVTTDVTKAVNDIKGGKIEFRVDKNSNLHFIIGKASFTADQLADNYAAAVEEVLRVKPNSSKGRYIAKAVVSSSMGPGIAVDPNLTREPAAN